MKNTTLRRLRCRLPALLLPPLLTWGLLTPVQAATPQEAVRLREQARSHEHGEGVARNMETALALYCQAALAGDAEARYSLGWIYTNGRGVDRNDGYAAWYLRQAAEQGDEPSRRLLGSISATAVKPPCVVQAEIDAREREAAAAAARVAEQARKDAEAAALRYRDLIVTAERKKIMGIVQRLAPQFGVHPGLAIAVIRAESNFDPQAVSPKNAQGLMQLIPETAARFNVKKPMDPEQNIRGGLAYLRWLLAYFKGDVTLAVAAYNAGEGAVERHLGVPPYPETQGYVRRVHEVFGLQQQPFDERITAPTPEWPRIASRPRS